MKVVSAISSFQTSLSSTFSSPSVFYLIPSFLLLFLFSMLGFFLFSTPCYQIVVGDFAFFPTLLTSFSSCNLIVLLYLTFSVLLSVFLISVIFFFFFDILVAKFKCHVFSSLLIFYLVSSSLLLFSIVTFFLSLPLASLFPADEGVIFYFLIANFQ